MTKDKKLMTPEMMDKCREGFPTEAYSAIESKSFLTTLKAFYVTERLNDVFGMGRWSIETEVIERTADYVLMQGEFHSLDYDVAVPKQFGGHNTTGKNTEIADGYKSAFTDCQSKIASYFEIGADMFKGKIHPGNKKKADPNDKRPWLNIKRKGTDVPTPQWHNVLKGIADGTIKSLKDLEPHYKVSKTTQAEIDKIFKNPTS